MKAIIVDDSRDYLTLVRRMLAGALPDIEVTEYDPDQSGRPDSDFNWSVYDVLLLDYHLGAGDTGLDWLRTYRSVPGFPPTILMTGLDDVYVAANAIKLGAVDYIRKSDLTAERLRTAVLEAAAQRDTRNQALTDAAASTFRNDASLFGKIVATEVGPDGTDIGYNFVRLIGQGACSRVYLAERARDRTHLVLKIIDVGDIQDTNQINRFIREAEIIAAIDSPYVVHFLDHGFTPHYGYIAMEFFPGGDLKQRLEPAAAPAVALRYFIDICRGLSAIHAAGIVHRDLKPGNIMFRADDTLALSDFGISRRLDITSDLTKVGSVLGTPNYLSPEQALGQWVDHRADLYAAGVILFELLSGYKPYRADSPTAIVYQHVHAEPPRLPAKLAAFQPLLDRLLAKRPFERYPTANDAIAAAMELPVEYG